MCFFLQKILYEPFKTCFFLSFFVCLFGFWGGKPVNHGSWQGCINSSTKWVEVVNSVLWFAFVRSVSGKQWFFSSFNSSLLCAYLHNSLLLFYKSTKGQGRDWKAMRNKTCEMSSTHQQLGDRVGPRNISDIAVIEDEWKWCHLYWCSGGSEIVHRRKVINPCNLYSASICSFVGGFF